MRRFVAVSFMLVLVPLTQADTFDPWTQPARYELEYRVELGTLLGSEKGPWRIWIPLPAESSAQSLVTEEVTSPWPWQRNTDELGNRMLYLEPDKPRGNNRVVIRWVVERKPYAGQPKAVSSDASADAEAQRFLKPQTRIPLDEPLRSLSQEVTKGCNTAAEKIRAAYDYVLRTMRYEKVGKGWGRGDAIWACHSKYGNCTDFHSVLIGLLRCQGIPARFTIGFPLPADTKPTEVSGYHCWAEAYDPAWGWRPVDASEAWKRKRHDDYFGHLPSDRVAFTLGRDLVLSPPQQGPPLNYFIYPYAEAGGKPCGRLPWKLVSRRLAEP